MSLLPALAGRIGADDEAGTQRKRPIHELGEPTDASPPEEEVLKLQTQSCLKLLGPSRTMEGCQVTWCYACWNPPAENSDQDDPQADDDDTLCAFKHVRILHYIGDNIVGYSTPYKHSGPLQKLKFREEWRPAPPIFQEAVALKVCRARKLTHHRLTLSQRALQKHVLPLVLEEIAHQDKHGRRLIAVTRELHVRDVCGACSVRNSQSSILFYPRFV
jgi:hypothetical protein